MPSTLGESLTVYDLVFPDLVMGENTVLCPFHSEKTPSMQINTIQRMHHCFGCGAGGGENDFIQQYYGIARNQATAFKTLLYNSDSIEEHEKYAREDGVYKNNVTYKRLVELGASEELLEQLLVGSEVVVETSEDGTPTIRTNMESKRLVFPVIIKDRIVDLRTYTTEPIKPKSTSKPHTPAGLILPYHLWIDNPDITVICEGEKDMVMARTHGFNAISLGGCHNMPTTLLDAFTDKKVYIVYDNDNPGRDGAKKLANTLYSVTKQVYIADIGKYVKEDKEDITDFFCKYKYTTDDFWDLLENAEAFDINAREAYVKASYPEVSLNEASTTHLGKTVRTNVQVMATFEEQYSVPSYATITKTHLVGKEEYNKHRTGDSEYWSLQKSNFEDVLVLTDNNLKSSNIEDNIKALVGWGAEEGVKVKTSNPTTVFKASIADCMESVAVKDIKRTEFVCYTNEKLEAGKNYQIIYKVVPHPYKGQQQVVIVTDVKESGDVITSFELNPDIKDDLREFQKYGFKELVEKQKAHIKCDVDPRLIEFIDLWYNTPKAFNFGYMQNIRAYLDGLIVAESRVGKSMTASALSQIYGLGQIASLAGSAATPAGLIGGSVKVGNGSQIRPGLIPRNHTKAIIFEELAKAKYSLMPELTDIRSSGLVRINRSTGDITLPALTRILFLSNPKTDDEGLMRPIMAYPNGIEIVKPLVGAIEDIARFDFIYVLGEVPKDVDPLWTPPEGFTVKQLQSRIRWIWSRKCEQIILSSEVQRYISDKAKALNEKYSCSVKIFSTETWKKVARLAIAIAGYMVSTDDTFENIIVTKRQVDIACVLLQSIYDNPVFKLGEFVKGERKTTEFTVEDVKKISDLRARYPKLVSYLANNNNVSKNTLQSVSALDSLSFGEALSSLTESSLITMTQFKVFPTPKFLIALKRLEETEA